MFLDRFVLRSNLKQLISKQFFSIRRKSESTIKMVSRFENIIKPREDDRKYLGLKLRNDLKVMLISDPETDISAASLSVHVGSMSDPWEIQGLAHFLEHMLFMGTKKYPDENEYSKFISQHGGSSNAYTSEVITNFFFDIDPAFLAGALDRFAQFFIDPLMLESSVSRELEAVNSEFSKNAKSDSWRLSQVKKCISRPNHDYGKFSIGNHETLRDSNFLKSGINIRDELFKFYNKHYSANLMCLCVLGKESLEELEDMVVPLFSLIENKNFEAANWPTHPYSDDQMLKQINVVPIKDIRSMNINFKYPDEIEHYKSSPGMYLSHLIGHENKGSLLSELKRLGLSSSLCSYVDQNDGFAFFTISVDLTEDALNRIDEILVLFFQYINMLKERGPQKYIFEEERNLNYIKFNFMEKRNPMNYVEKIASKMLYYPMEDVLRINCLHFLMDEYRPDLINENIEYLKPENCNIILVSKSFTGDTDLKDKYFGTEYKIIDMREDLISKLKNPGKCDNLFLPEPNEFVPENFDLLPIEVKDNSNIPSLIINSDQFKVWHLQDDIYHKPRAYYAFNFVNPVVYSTPYNANVVALFIQLFRDHLTEFLYNAELTDLHFGLRNSSIGLELMFMGFNDKMAIFFKRIFEKMIDFKVCPKRFEIIKERVGRELRNYKTHSLYHLTGYYLDTVTRNIFWSYEDLIESLDTITYDAIQDLPKIFFSNFSIEAFFHGNINKKQALELTDFIQEKVIKHYKSVPLKNSHRFLAREIILEPNCYYSYEVINDIQLPKAINIYFQVSFDNIEDACKLSLIDQILSEPFFDQLRTKEQLGYVTYCHSREYSGVHGFNFVIQSDYNVDYLESRIENFLGWAKSHLQNITDEEFESERKALLTKILKKKKKLFEYSSYLWAEIKKEIYHFQKKEDYAQVVKTLTKEDIASFFNKHLSADSSDRKKMVIKVVKSDAEANKSLPPDAVENFKTESRKEPTLIKNAAEFTKYQMLHPRPKPKIDLSQQVTTTERA